MTKKKPKTRWQKVISTLYHYRGWWVDSPTISLLGLFHWHFYSQLNEVVHRVPDGMPEFCWAVLVMYWLVKEGVRWSLHEIQSRRGGILVGVWLGSIMEFYFIIAWNPALTMPPQMVETTLIILGGFLGLIPIKRAFAKKYPWVIEAFVPHNEEVR